MVFLFALRIGFCHAQNQNITQLPDSNAAKLQITENKSDSVKVLPNAVIQSNVNKDGVIEIKRSEFNKIPLVRQEMMLKDKNYKIIED